MVRLRPLLFTGVFFATIWAGGCVGRNKDLAMRFAVDRSNPAEALRIYLKRIYQSDKVAPRDRHKVPMYSWAEFGMDETPAGREIEMLVLSETLNGRTLHRLVREKFGKHITASQIHAPILTDRAIDGAMEYLQPQRVRIEDLPTNKMVAATRVHFHLVDTLDSHAPLHFHMLDGPVVILWRRQAWRIYPRATFGMRGTIKEADIAKPLNRNPSLAAKRILQHRRMSGVIAALREDEIKSLEELNARLQEIFPPANLELQSAPSTNPSQAD